MLFVAWAHMAKIFKWSLSGNEGSVNIVLALYYWPIAFLLSIVIFFLSFKREKKDWIKIVLPIFGIIALPLFFYFFSDPGYDALVVMPSEYIRALSIIF